MKPLNILIVDDSAMMRRIVRRAVKLTEVPVADVHEAGNGHEALAVLDATRRCALHRHQHAGDDRPRAAARARASGAERRRRASSCQPTDRTRGDRRWRASRAGTSTSRSGQR